MAYTPNPTTGLFSGTQPFQMYQSQGLTDDRPKDMLTYIPWDALPENSPARALPKGAPGTHYVGDKPYAIHPGAAYNSDPAFGIQQFYRQIFGRDPDQAGLDYWLGRQKEGLSDIDFVKELYNSQEKTRVTPEQNAYVKSQFDAGFPDFVKMKPGKNGGTFASDNGAVQRVYAEMLGRLPSQEEIAYWSPLFKQNGMSDAWFRREIQQSPEYKNYQSTGVASKTDVTNPLDKYANEGFMVNYYAKLGGNDITKPINTTAKERPWWVGKEGAEFYNASMQQPEYKAWANKVAQRPRQRSGGLDDDTPARMLQPNAPTQRPTGMTMNQQISALQQPQGLRPSGLFSSTNMPKRW